MAADDIVSPEVRKDVVKWVLDTVQFYVFTNTAKVSYRKVDSDGNGVGEKNIIFKNIQDDPDTPEDESSTEFTQLIQKINSESNIKQSITDAVKLKLGI